MASQPIDYLRVSGRRIVIDDDEQTNGYDDVRELIRLDGKRLGILGQTFIWRGVEYQHDDKTDKVREVARIKGSKRYVEGLFWRTKFDKDTHEQVAKIKYSQFIDFLYQNGFGRRIMPEGMGYDYVRLERDQNLLHAIHRNTDQIQDFVNDYLREIGNEAALDMMMAGASTHYHETKLRNLPPIDIQAVTDDKNTAWMFYRNTAVRITADSIKAIPYDKIPGQVWAHQLIQRDYQPTTMAKIMAGPWCRFMAFALCEDAGRFMQAALSKSPDQLQGADDLLPRRLLSGLTAYGYLLHGYKDPAVTKAVTAVDRSIARDLSEANGGSGKSLSGKALSHLVLRVELPGRTFKIDKGFLLSRLTPETQIMHMPDMHPKFRLDDIFNWLTDDMEVERKGKDAFIIPYSMSPKWLLDTNYVPWGEGSAYRRRMHILEYSNYFNDERTPLSVFGKRFFEEWDADEWAAFDGFYILALQRFLRYGLVPFPTENWQTRTLLRAMPEEVIQFFDDYIQMGTAYTVETMPVMPGQEHVPSILGALTEAYREVIGQDLTARRLKSWLRRWAAFNGYYINGMPANADTPRQQIRQGNRRADSFTFTNPTTTTT